MRRLAITAILCAAAARGEEPTLIFNPLPLPLRLPPDLVETLPLVPAGSFFGEAIRTVDCPDAAEALMGICGNQLFGGLVMGESRLNGSVTLRFTPPTGSITHFTVSHGVLRGEDSWIEAPQGYRLPVLNASVSDAPGFACEGDLDLTTGGVSGFRCSLRFSDSAIDAMFSVNPKLQPMSISFPGARGHTWVRFDQRADGLLDYTFRGSTFLPFGPDIDGDPVRFPLPICPPGGSCASILARGTSFHPHLYLSTRAPEGPECGERCPEIPVNTIRQYTVSTYHSSFGDDFSLDIPELGGAGAGRSHLQGRLQIQFGPRTGDIVPFVVNSLVPEGLFARPPESDILGRGPAPGLIGQNELLRFPLLTYRLERVVFVDEPYNFTHGAVDLRTGRVVGDMAYPSFYGQSLADVLFRQNAPRISTDPFFLVARRPAPGEPETTYALFEKGANGETVFRYSGEHKRSFAGFTFPTPELRLDRGMVAGPAGTLDLFLRLQAIDAGERTPARMEGGASGVISSLGDRFSYAYSIPCDTPGAPFSFEYTNENGGASGGTFRMKRLAAATCTPSRGIVTFSGFGTWSKDDAGATPRFASVQISTAPDAPYAGVIVYQNPDAAGDVVLSSANTKPAEKPLP